MIGSDPILVGSPSTFSSALIVSSFLLLKGANEDLDTHESVDTVPEERSLLCLQSKYTVGWSKERGMDRTRHRRVERS